MTGISNALNRDDLIGQGKVKRQTLIELYLQGRTIKSLESEFRLGHGKIKPILEAEGIEIRGVRKQLPEQQIAAWYGDGISENEIAKRLGVNRWAIRRRLTEQGVTLRSQSESERIKWTTMSPEERAAQVAAAHEAARGRYQPIDERVRRAKGRELRQSHVSAEERAIEAMLAPLGLPITVQKAVWKYNIDIAVGDSIAVEVFGGNWHTTEHHSAKAQERARYLFDEGWHLYVIWTSKRYGIADISEDFTSFAQLASGDPPETRRYRVIWSDGKLIAAGSSDDEHIPIERPRRGR